MTGPERAEEDVMQSQTLTEFHNDLSDGIDELYIYSPGFPGGLTLRPDELDGYESLWDLTGSVGEDGSWEWDGDGHPRDERGNTIQAVRAWP